MSEELANKMRQGMRVMASGVCVVSANDTSGNRYAMTASSVTSLSDSPASLLVCINQEAKLHPVLSETPYFSVNVLAQKHEGLSNLCATPTEEDENRFTLGEWQQDAESGVFYVADAPATFICEKQKTLDYGTHTIVIGNITNVVCSGKPEPLLAYVNGQYVYI